MYHAKSGQSSVDVSDQQNPTSVVWDNEIFSELGPLRKHHFPEPSASRTLAIDQTIQKIESARATVGPVEKLILHHA